MSWLATQFSSERKDIDVGGKKLSTTFIPFQEIGSMTRDTFRRKLLRLPMEIRLWFDTTKNSTFMKRNCPVVLLAIPQMDLSYSSAKGEFYTHICTNCRTMISASSNEHIHLNGSCRTRSDCFYQLDCLREKCNYKARRNYLFCIEHADTTIPCYLDDCRDPRFGVTSFCMMHYQMEYLDFPEFYKWVMRKIVAPDETTRRRAGFLANDPELDSVSSSYSMESEAEMEIDVKQAEEESLEADDLSSSTVDDTVPVTADEHEPQKNTTTTSGSTTIPITTKKSQPTKTIESTESLKRPLEDFENSSPAKHQVVEDETEHDTYEFETLEAETSTLSPSAITNISPNEETTADTSIRAVRTRFMKMFSDSKKTKSCAGTIWSFRFSACDLSIACYSYFDFSKMQLCLLIDSINIHGSARSARIPGGMGRLKIQTLTNAADHSHESVNLFHEASKLVHDAIFGDSVAFEDIWKGFLTNSITEKRLGNLGSFFVRRQFPMLKCYEQENRIEFLFWSWRAIWEMLRVGRTSILKDTRGILWDADKLDVNNSVDMAVVMTMCNSLEPFYDYFRFWSSQSPLVSPVLFSVWSKEMLYSRLQESLKYSKMVLSRVRVLNDWRYGIGEFNRLSYVELHGLLCDKFQWSDSLNRFSYTASDIEGFFYNPVILALYFTHGAKMFQNTSTSIAQLFQETIESPQFKGIFESAEVIENVKKSISSYFFGDVDTVENLFIGLDNCAFFLASPYIIVEWVGTMKNIRMKSREMKSYFNKVVDLLCIPANPKTCFTVEQLASLDAIKPDTNLDNLIYTLNN